MKYMLLIHQGSTPLPGTPEWESLSAEEQGAVYAAYGEVNQTPGMTPGESGDLRGQLDRGAAGMGGAVEVRPLVEG